MRGERQELLINTEFTSVANLIAAAPDLLDAAIAARDHACCAFECGEDRKSCPVRRYLNDAIAKAGGK